jgi:hypothetical protein
LSGGGLGVSFAFVDSFVEGSASCTSLLMIAWGCWGTSVAIALFSYLASHKSLQTAIRKLDKAICEGKEDDLNAMKLGGAWSTATHVLNLFDGLLFVLGVLFAALFAGFNL